jgi:hypothetical protein
MNPTKLPSKCPLCDKNKCDCIEKIKNKIRVLSNVDEDNLNFRFEVEREILYQQYYKKFHK